MSKKKRLRKDLKKAQAAQAARMRYAQLVSAIRFWMTDLGAPPELTQGWAELLEDWPEMSQEERSAFILDLLAPDPSPCLG